MNKTIIGAFLGLSLIFPVISHAQVVEPATTNDVATLKAELIDLLTQLIVQLQAQINDLLKQQALQGQTQATITQQVNTIQTQVNTPTPTILGVVSKPNIIVSLHNCCRNDNNFFQNTSVVLKPQMSDGSIGQIEVSTDNPDGFSSLSGQSATTSDEVISTVNGNVNIITQAQTIGDFHYTFTLVSDPTITTTQEVVVR